MAKRRKNTEFYWGNANRWVNAWLDLITKSSEIGLASGQTIMHRMLMMSGADILALTTSERREFSRMYTEKVQAATAHGQIMAGEMMRLNQQIAIAAGSQWWSGWMAMATLGVGRNPSDMFSARSRMIKGGARRAGNATQDISIAMTRSASAGLKPFHTRVSANAKRLGRQQR